MSNKSTLQIARSFGKVVPVEGRDGWWRLEAPWKEVAGFFRRMSREGRVVVGPWTCDVRRSTVVFYPWQE